MTSEFETDEILVGLRRQLASGMAGTGVNYSELARNSGVKPSFIYDILNSKSLNPSVVKLCKVAKTLNMSLTQLLGLDGCRHHEYESLVPIAWLDASGGDAAVMFFQESWLKAYLPSVKKGDLRLYSVATLDMIPSLQPRDLVMLDIGTREDFIVGLYLVRVQQQVFLRHVMKHANKAAGLFVLTPCDGRLFSQEVSVSEVELLGRVVWRTTTYI